MKTVLAAAFGAALLPFGGAAFADHQTHTHSHSHDTHAQMRVQEYVITVSCFRGPIREVIWDHPRAVFLESLVNYGYSYSEAESIANRICRDVTIVGNEQAQIDATYAVIAAQPPGTRRN